MKLTIQNFTLFISFLIFPLVLFGQNKSISRDAFYSALREATTKTEKQTRKRVSTQKLFSNGTINATYTNTIVYIPPDKSRWIGIEERGNIVKRIEQIRVGNFYYRKEDNGEWVKRKVDENVGIGGGTDDSTREYFIEDATIGNEKFQVLIEKTVNYNKTYFDERRIWINKVGLIFKESSTTSYKELKNIVSSDETSYDYEIKPSEIEAPIK